MVGGVVAREKSAKSQLNAGRRTLFSSYHIIKVNQKLNFKWEGCKRKPKDQELGQVDHTSENIMSFLITVICISSFENDSVSFEIKEKFS